MRTALGLHETEHADYRRNLGKSEAPRPTVKRADRDLEHSELSGH
jgi:hypothetical protein